MLTFLKSRRSVLGMNARNLLYIRPNNLSRAKRIADNKLLSKKVLTRAALPTPKLIAALRTREELEQFDWNKLPESFVLKPNRGFGGGGIIVVYGKKKHAENTWVKSDGSPVTVNDLKEHIQNILDGSFSLSGTSDSAFFEERLKIHKLLKPYAYRGVPDIRVIVYNRVPVMAMLRLPTKSSGGKANLQLGAIGTGIDLASGTTTTAVFGKEARTLEYFPETRLLLSGIRIPFWKTILHLAVKAQEASGLGFLGADIAIDREKGPVFLELNARPGLSIQVANQSGLKERLVRVKGLKIKTIERAVRVGMDLFGGEIEEGVEDISGKKVIGTVEKVKLFSKDGKEIEVEAKIDTGAYSSSIDTELARKLGFGDTIKMFESVDVSSYVLVPENEKKIKKDFLETHGKDIPFLENVAVVFSASGASIRPIVRVNLVMDGESIASQSNIVNRSGLQYPMLIGRKDLRKFLIRMD